MCDFFGLWHTTLMVPLRSTSWALWCALLLAPAALAQAPGEPPPDATDTPDEQTDEQTAADPAPGAAADPAPEAAPEPSPGTMPAASPAGEQGPSGGPDATLSETAEDPDDADARPDEDEDGLLGPFGVSLVYENSVGRGSMTLDGYDRRPYWNMLFSIKPKVTFKDYDLTVALKFDFSFNVVENADSGNTRPHQVQPGDVRLTAAWEPSFMAYKPLGLTTWFSGGLSFPTSYYSQLMTKVLGLHVSAGAGLEPLDWLSAEVRVGVSKSFNQYTNAVLDGHGFDVPLLTRAGGRESVAEGRLALSSGATSHVVSWGTGVTFTFLEDFSATVDFEMVHAFSYQQIGKDHLSSPYAQDGTGRSELMYGTI